MACVIIELLTVVPCNLCPIFFCPEARGSVVG
jgi:hypothetical protein